MSSSTNIINYQGALPTMRRPQRNNIKRRFDDLDIEKMMSKSLSEVTDLKKKSPVRELKNQAKKIKVATDAVQSNAEKRAEDFRRGLHSSHHSFVRLMLPSHVSGGFWLGLPSHFCKDHHHFSKDDHQCDKNCDKSKCDKLNMVVIDQGEDEEYNVVYLRSKTGLSGGWRRFSVDHKLKAGDVLVFELIERTKFKVHIFKGDGNGELDVEATKYGRKLLNSNQAVKESETVIDETCKQDVRARVTKARIVKIAKKSITKHEKKLAKPVREKKPAKKVTKEAKKQVVKVPKAVKYFRKRTKYC